jgi:hypothetical protein
MEKKKKYNPVISDIESNEEFINQTNYPASRTRFIQPPIYISIYPSIHPSTYQYFHVPLRLSIKQSVYPFIYPFIHPSIRLQGVKIEDNYIVNWTCNNAHPDIFF